MKAKYQNITFDDFVTKHQDNNGNWSQICRCCVNKYQVKDDVLDESGSGICGVENCFHQADFYIDFPEDEFILIDKGDV